MKATELRIGNYVRTTVTHTEFKTNIDELTVILSEPKDHQLEPIPLTEEWLLKFGFERNVLNAKHNDIIYYSENNIGVKGILGMVKPSKCIYVHQLQNLYFALTGEELTIKTK